MQQLKIELAERLVTQSALQARLDEVAPTNNLEEIRSTAWMMVMNARGICSCIEMLQVREAGL